MKKVEKTKHRLSEAALEVFAEKGFAGATVPEIVKRAKMAHGTFYRYFKNKQACFNHLLKDLMHAVFIDFERTMDDKEKNAVISRPLRMIKLLRKYRDVLRLAILEDQHVEPELMLNYYQIKTKIGNHYVDQLMARGDSEQSAKVKAMLIASVLESFVLNEIVMKSPTPALPNVSMEQQLECIIYGFNQN